MPSTDREFWLHRPSTTHRVNVRVNPNHYGKGLDVVNGLAEELKAKIPFPHKIASGPDVQILGGSRVRGIVSVEMTITYEISDDDAVAQLRAQGFLEGTEVILG